MALMRNRDKRGNVDSVETTMLEQALSAEIGDNATFRQYDRSLHTPMNFVLDEAKRNLEKEFVVYWVEGGLPEIFCLSGFSEAAVVYNTRYIELVYLFRRLIPGNSALKEFTPELAERISLRVMAELALRHNHPDW